MILRSTLSDAADLVFNTFAEFQVDVIFYKTNTASFSFATGEVDRDVEQLSLKGIVINRTSQNTDSGNPDGRLLIIRKADIGTIDDYTKFSVGDEGTYTVTDYDDNGFTVEFNMVGGDV